MPLAQNIEDVRRRIALAPEKKSGELLNEFERGLIAENGGVPPFPVVTWWKKTVIWGTDGEVVSL